MIYWIKRGGRLFGATVFFAVLISMMLRPDMLSLRNSITALACALLTGSIGWFIGTVVCDILLKGVCADLGDGGAESLVEGGILQRLQMMNEQMAPGGEEMPFEKNRPPARGERKKRKK
ncbi:MAG: hypothetical protein JW913_17865 [Chitinispirillaceae bacterium]|nr:hypothetical protein [Chitinispirillaceae bacterium]